MLRKTSPTTMMRYPICWQIDENGLFTPAEDGPNMKRERMEHNVGDVWVEAWYTPDGAKRPMGARAPMLVMPEKFSFQPIE